MKKNLSLISLVIVLGIMCFSFVYAEDPSDATTGPGVGLSSSSWDGQGKIYTAGQNGIVGDYVSPGNAMEVAPTTHESNILNPVNNYAIDMGPTTANNWQLDLHFIDDNGPGKKMDSSIISATSIYNNVGPGANIPKETYVDKGPVYADMTTTNIDPANALKDWGPASSTEFYQHKKKEQ